MPEKTNLFSKGSSDKNVFRSIPVELGEELHQERKEAAKTPRVESGRKLGSPTEWRKAVESNPAFRREEVERLEQLMGKGKGAREFLRIWGVGQKGKGQ